MDPVLIVAAIGVANGWIGADWLVILAIALAFTFIIAAPANSLAHAIYARWCDRLRCFESAERLAEDAPLDTGKATVAVIGMGGIGTAAYDEMRRRHGDVVVGASISPKRLWSNIANRVGKWHSAMRRTAIFGSAPIQPPPASAWS